MSIFIITPKEEQLHGREYMLNTWAHFVHLNPKIAA